jgi:hypothetical protein
MCNVQARQDGRHFHADTNGKALWRVCALGWHKVPSRQLRCVKGPCVNHWRAWGRAGGQAVDDAGGGVWAGLGGFWAREWKTWGLAWPTARLNSRQGVKGASVFGLVVTPGAGAKRANL